MFQNRADGGPLCADNAVSVLIYRCHDRLAAHGWRIESAYKLGLGNSLGYRLVLAERAGG